MTAQKRLPQAPSTPTSELAEFLQPSWVDFTFEKSFTSLERYLTGLLTEHPNKNCATIPTVVPGTPASRFFPPGATGGGTRSLPCIAR